MSGLLLLRYTRAGRRSLAGQQRPCYSLCLRSERARSISLLAPGKTKVSNFESAGGTESLEHFLTRNSLPKICLN